MKPGDYKKLNIVVGEACVYDFIVVEILEKSKFPGVWEVKNILSNTCFYVGEEELW